MSFDLCTDRRDRRCARSAVSALAVYVIRKTSYDSSSPERADEEARAPDRGMWEVVGRQEPDGSFVAQATGPAPENGEFWADALDRIKDDPDQRYAMARRHLPLPAAWRERSGRP